MKKLVLGLFLICCIVLTGCGSNDKKASKENGTQEESASMSDEQIYKKLGEIRDMYTTKIWNEGLCDLDAYVKTGTSSTGEELDAEMTLKTFTESMNEFKEYNTFVTGLKDKKYDDVKYAWDKLYKAVQESDKIVHDNKIEPNSNLDIKTGILTQYSKAFSDYITKLNS